MKKFLYIISWWPPINGRPSVDQDDSVLCFSHSFITAETREDAESIGWQQVANAHIVVAPEAVLDNDYVVELPHRLEVI